MFRITKLLDREWYFRKWMVVASHLLSRNRIERMRFMHALRMTYRQTFFSRLHLHNPRTLNEKLIWLALYWRNPLKVVCADKFKVRDYLVNQAGLPSSLLVPLLMPPMSSVEELRQNLVGGGNVLIDSKLRDGFVVKCNHGSGYNYIVRNSIHFDIDDLIVKIGCWLEEDYLSGQTEDHYNFIHPHVILCEKYLNPLGEKSIIDYKIHCFNGEPDYVHVCYDRDDSGLAKFATYTLDWRQLFYVTNEKPLDLERPICINRMIEYSRRLSKPFPYVRVDWYDVNYEPILGEMTFTPHGNMIDYYKEEVLLSLGKKLKLPHKYKARDAY